MTALMQGVSADEAATSRAMARALADGIGYVDPHTAVALAGADLAGQPAAATPLVILATAHPAKFPQAVAAATGHAPPIPAAVAALAGLEERIDSLPADAEAVKAYVRGFVRD
jgi:threonine synthase